MVVEVKVRKLHKDAVIPKQMTEGAAGFDLTAISMTVTGKYHSYDTCLSIEIPKGYVGILAPRSSITNTCQRLANSVGILDSDYRGSISFRFDMSPTERGDMYFPGDRIGQLVIVPIPQIELVEVDELTETARGTGGYGHTGVK